MNEPLEQRVMEIVAQSRDIPLESIQIESTFEQLEIDSLQGLNIVFALEDAFGISVPNERALQVHSIRDLVASLREFLTEQAVSDTTADRES